MSKVKVSFLVFGLMVAAAVAFFFTGTSQLIASSKTSSCASATVCGLGGDAKAVPACASVAAAKTDVAVKACPFSTASAQEDSGKKCSEERKSHCMSKCESACKSAGKSDCKSDCKSACKSTCKSACKPMCTSKSSKAASIEDLPYREGTRIVLTGRYVCGLCNLRVTEKCQPGFQTKEGQNYLLVTNNLSDKLHGTARDNDVEIVSRVRKLNGVKYLEVDVVRPLT